MLRFMAATEFSYIVLIMLLLFSQVSAFFLGITASNLHGQYTVCLYVDIPTNILYQIMMKNNGIKKMEKLQSALFLNIHYLLLFVRKITLRCI